MSCAFCGRENDAESRFCMDCGKPINPDRLEARPAAQYDIECQELADRGLI